MAHGRISLSLSLQYSGKIFHRITFTIYEIVQATIPANVFGRLIRSPGTEMMYHLR